MELSFLNKKEKTFLVLDIGTKAVKTLIVKKNTDKISIVGSSVQYFEDEGVFDGSFTIEDFEIEKIKRAVLKAAKEAFLNFNFTVGEKNLKKETDLPVLLTLNPKILRAQALDEFSIRNTKEKKISRKEQEIIYKYVVKSAKDDILNSFSKSNGILAKDIEFIFVDIIDKQIEGYSVDNIYNYQGKNLSFKVLAVFVMKDYFERIIKMLRESGFKVIKTIHLVQAVSSVFKDIARDAAFLDVGGEATQIFLLNKGILDRVEIINRGGQDFTERIFDILMTDKREARILKEKYSAESLAPETKEKIKDILSAERDLWQDKLKKYQKASVFLFGGSSNLPEVKDIFRRRKIVKPQGFKKIEDLTKKTKNPQFTPAVLISLIQ